VKEVLLGGREESHVAIPNTKFEVTFSCPGCGGMPSFKFLTSPQLAASLNSTRKTAVSKSTVKRQLQDAGLLGRVAKKKPYLRLANKNKRLRWAKEYRH
jgi:hypothetical protein